MGRWKERELTIRKRENENKRKRKKDNEWMENEWIRTWMEMKEREEKKETPMRNEE